MTRPGPHASRLLLAGSLLVTAGAAGETNWDEADKRWIKGPVSYLATEEEEKAYRDALDDAARAELIAAFWRRRDPSPDTEANEFRDRFYGRVEAADQALREKGLPAGWKSDPGRVLILLGQPAAVRSSGPSGGGDAATPSVPAPANPYGGGVVPELGAGEGGGATMTFVYPDLSRFGLPRNLEIAFEAEGLSYRVLTRVDLGSAALRGLDREVLAQEFPTGAAAKEERLTLTPQAPAAAAATPPAPLSSAPPQRQVLDALLADGGGREDLPVSGAVDFYKSRDGATYVAITVGVAAAKVRELGLDLADLHPIAGLRDVADPDNVFLYDADDLFAPADAGDADIRRFQAGDGVRPGTYRIAFGLTTSDGEKVGARVEEVAIPDFEAAGVQISSLTFAARLETAEAGGGDLKRPYVLGNRKVVPRVDATFPVGGSLTLYYQVYNAVEGADGSPSLRVSYNFYKKSGTRYVKAGTAPPAADVKDLVFIYELPLAGWPKGDYKIKVTVTDNLNGTFAERELPFQVG
jgi:GWxTD domain-containing protein